MGLLKAKLAKLRREIIEPKSGGGGGGKGEGFDVARTGDARVGFVGFPSVGKSTLLSNLAGVYSEVAAYEFTTLTTVPGVIRYKGPAKSALMLKNSWKFLRVSVTVWVGKIFRVFKPQRSFLGFLTSLNTNMSLIFLSENGFQRKFS